MGYFQQLLLAFSSSSFYLKGEGPNYIFGKQGERNADLSKMGQFDQAL